MDSHRLPLMLLIVAAMLLALPLLACRPPEPQAPTITITDVPSCGGSGRLQGRVSLSPDTSGACDYGAYAVAVTIYVDGWWTKPNRDAPLTRISDDGAWRCFVVTGGRDAAATRFAAFLVPVDASVPILTGVADLPAELLEMAQAQVIIERPCDAGQLTFAGSIWDTKASVGPVGPGGNWFSDAKDAVWVDDQGQLHLTIRHVDGHWQCTEVINQEPLTYGQMVFRIQSAVDDLDPNVVLGLFTWHTDAPQEHYRELDVELSRWSVAGALNAQFVVQPWDVPGNRYRFRLREAGPTSHAIRWAEDEVSFQSWYGLGKPEEGQVIESWTYAGGDNPRAGGGHVRINFWLNEARPPIDGQDVEVIIAGFEQQP